MGKTKTCAHCGRNLSAAKFGPDKTAKDGLRAYCRECRRELDRERAAKKREAAKKAAKQLTSAKTKVATKAAPKMPQIAQKGLKSVLPPTPHKRDCLLVLDSHKTADLVHKAMDAVYALAQYLNADNPCKAIVKPKR